ncbi:MAG: alkaline phosphatase D family protein [Burkholderiaceae bacterium]
MPTRSLSAGAAETRPLFGPILFSRGSDEAQHRVDAVWVTSSNEPAEIKPMGEASAPIRLLDQVCGHYVWQASFALPVADTAFYLLGEQQHSVCTAIAESTRLAYVSCNGQENEDATWTASERNRVWQMLADHHAKQPLALLMHGGDQLYADDIVNAHPELAQWFLAPLPDKGGLELSPHARSAAEHFMFERYARLYGQPAIGQLLAQVPSLMMWDDHDIMDGWGSHPTAMLDSEIGRGLFEICRRFFLIFQRGLAPAKPDTMTYAAHYPGLSIVAPDLRSERRPDQIMGEAGWHAAQTALDEVPDNTQLLIMSSVPLLGPRLSWLERVADWIPGAATYKDDLRDQWQSRSHRAEWQRMLKAVEQRAVQKRLNVTVLSGEIHLATQASMPFRNDALLTQYVASGIAHPPPPTAFARALGWLATLGEDPLPDQPISIKPIPGQTQIYTAQRNFLLLTNNTNELTAQWVLERDGPTPAISVARTL